MDLLGNVMAILIVNRFKDILMTLCLHTKEFSILNFNFYNIQIAASGRSKAHMEGCSPETKLWGLPICSRKSFKLLKLIFNYLGRKQVINVYILIEMNIWYSQCYS